MDVSNYFVPPEYAINDLNDQSILYYRMVCKNTEFDMIDVALFSLKILISRDKPGIDCLPIV
jgi:hypothetical protein